MRDLTEREAELLRDMLDVPDPARPCQACGVGRGTSACRCMREQETQALFRSLGARGYAILHDRVPGYPRRQWTRTALGALALRLHYATLVSMKVAV